MQITSVSSPSGWESSTIFFGLRDAAESMLGQKIEIQVFSVSETQDYLPAFITSTMSKKIILVGDISNFCWKRFFTCKELCHAIMEDRDITRTKTAQECFRLISDLKSPPLPQANEHPGCSTEYAAYCGAIELLLPPEFCAEIRESHKNGLDYHTLALKYRVPKIIIEHVLTSSSLINFIESIRKTHKYKTLNITQHE